MKSSSFIGSAVGSLIFLKLGLSSFSALAVTTFGEQEVGVNSIIAVARPYGDGKYDLLVIEQLPGQRQCWQEIGSQPTSIDPMLLNFDFTGSCERSTDSNGYSIRIKGEDYGLDYLFRVVERDGELWLVGSPRRNRSQPELVVGRTYGLKQGLLKISLNPGWRMTKRTLSGTPLHHIYFSAQNDNLGILPESPTPLPTTSSPPTNSPSQPIKEWKFTAPPPASIAPSPPSLPPVASSTPLPPPSLPPVASSTPLPPPSLPPVASSTPLLPPSLPPVTSSTPLPPLPPVVPSSPLPPPSRSSENGRKNLSELLPLPSNSVTSLPPVSKSPVSIFRVIVLAKNSQEQQKTKEIYPDAFSTAYQGKSVLQVGRFGNRANAQLTLDSLKSAGLQGVIVQ